MGVFVMLLALGCGGDGGANSNDLVSDQPPGGDDTPRVTLDSPAAGAFLSEGTHEVTGVAWRVSDVVVSGMEATASDGRYSTAMVLGRGLTTLEVTATGEGGAALSDAGSVLAGDFAAPQGSRPRAIQAHLSAEGLRGLGPLFGNLLDPVALSKQLQSLNPVVEDGDATVDIEDVRFDPVQIDIVPIRDALLLTVIIEDFVLGIDATIEDALPFGIDLSLSPDVEADQVLLVTELSLSTDGQGGLTGSLGPLSVDLVGFDLDTGLLELIDWIFIDDDDLAVTLEEQLADAASELQPTIDEALAGLDLATELDLLDQTVALVPSFDDVTIDPSGMTLALGVALDVLGAERDVPGHLTLPAPSPESAGDVGLQISDDFMNRMLFELWAGGALDLDLEMDATTRFLFGADAEGTLAMSPNLPPVWLEKGGSARLQLGEVLLSVDTPGGTYGDAYEIIMAIDARAELKLSNTSFGIVLSDAQIHMRPGPSSADNIVLIQSLPNLATTFGVGIGVINGLLSFDLSEQLGKGAVLPDLEFQRDTAGLSTVLALGVNDLLILLGQDPPPPTYPKGLAVQVPATTTVYDQDGEEPADNVEGWVCGRDDIDATGNDGIWYLEDNAEVVVFGTGHTVYAVDGSDVVLEGPDNLVYAAPGVNVRDRDNGNVVITVDPLTLDTSSGPKPGCP